MLLDHLRSASRRDSQWDTLIDPFFTADANTGIHIAVLVEPYLRFILDGTKTVESRFSRNGCAPYKRVTTGHLVLLKKPAGPIVGACFVSDVWFYRLTPAVLQEIRQRFGPAIQPQYGFWEARANAAFATLMRLVDVQVLPSVHIPKRDRRGWVVLRNQASAALS